MMHQTVKPQVPGKQLPWALPNRLVLALVMLLIVAIACRKAIVSLLKSPTHPSFDIGSYTQALLIPNYIDNGFIRRGLGGTIVYLLDGGSAAHASGMSVVFHLFGAVFLAIPLALLLHRLAARGDRSWWWFALFLIVSPQMFWGWSRDVGRADMLICGFIAWSVIAAVRGQFWLAAIILVAGSLTHETAIIFGGPLLVALWFVAHRQGRATTAQGVSAVALLGILLALSMVAQSIGGDRLAEIAATVRAGRGAAPVAAGIDPYDFATFLTWGGPVAIRDTLCGVATETALPFVIISSFIILLLNFRVLHDRSWLMKGVFGFAALLPMIFICAVAVDYGRWLMFAVTNAWLAAVAVRITGAETLVIARRDQAIALGVLAALVAMGPADVRYPSVATRLLEQRMFGPWAGKSGRWLTQCDPGWQRRLHADTPLSPR